MQKNTADVKTISPQEAQEKLEAGARILDVREYLEWIERHIPGAELVPLPDLKREPQRGALADEVVVVCQTGKRAAEAAALLSGVEGVQPFVVAGGIESWQSAGLPTRQALGGPISIERQIRIGAGAVVLLGLLVPRVRFVSWFVACGLIVSGMTGVCGTARLLTRAPWNRPPRG